MALRMTSLTAVPIPHGRVQRGRIAGTSFGHGVARVGDGPRPRIGAVNRRVAAIGAASVVRPRRG